MVVSRMSPTARGYLCIMLAAVMWASSGTAGKALFDQGVSPFALVQVRVTFATLILAAVFALGARRLFVIRFRQDLVYFLLLGGLGMAFNNLCYFYAISKIQVAAAILLQYLSPVLVACFSIFFWKEKASPSKILALGLAFGGCYLVVGGYDLHLLKMNRLGILSGIGAAVSFAGYTLLAEHGMHRYPPWTVHFYALAFAALTWHILYSPLQYVVADYSLLQWIWLLYVAVVGTIIPFGLYFVGINFIRSTRAGITAMLEPISAGILAFAFLGESLELLQITGGGLVVGAIVLLQLRREHDRLAPALIRAQRGLSPF
jgi:drug/metabolite transporter (DMT)-like permease